MHSYAQTAVCLYNQLRENNYSNREIELVDKTYKFSKLLFSGRFQPSGKDFLSHCVGTASILASVHLPAELVAAALIHNVYQNGDFGDGKKFISKSKRQYVRKVIVNEVEKYAAEFATLSWNSTTIADIRSRIKNLSTIEKNVVLLRLADILEHLLDLDVLFYGDKGTIHYIANAHICEEISGHLGYPVLAEEFRKYYSEINSGQIPIDFITQKKASYMVIPQSYKKRLLVIILERIRKFISKIKSRRIINFKNSPSFE